jgi:hypothetical protein
MQAKMGIHGLSKFLGDQCPHVLRETKLENHFGRKIGLDASMAMYQFLVLPQDAPFIAHAHALLVRWRNAVSTNSAHRLGT